MTYEVEVQIDGNTATVEVEADFYRVQKKPDQYIFWVESKGANQPEKIVASFPYDRVVWVKDVS